ncbi:MAG: nitrous oxide reductase accessory protein NosL [bacterium]
MTHNRTTVKLPRPAGWIAAGLCIAVLACLPGTGHADIRHKERCNITQLVLEDCPNGIRADFDNGRHLWSFAVAGPIAFAEKMETYLEQPVTIYIVDYPTRNDENRRMVDVEKAWFLYDAEGDETLSQAPHIYGFREKDAAVAAQKEVGGELKRWDYVFEEVTAIAADWDRSAKHRHGSLREGRK